MDKAELEKVIAEVRSGWESVIDRLGTAGIERPGATSDWRVRDVLAHFNGWDRWQLVQLRCAFNGEIATDAELTGGVEFPPNDDMREDAMNNMFVEGNRSRPTEDVVADWRELCQMRAEWVRNASQEDLETLIGANWESGSSQIVCLVSELPSATNQERVEERILDQVEHQRLHLAIVEDWLRNETA